MPKTTTPATTWDIAWHQGMPLQPQHLQHLQLHWQRRAQAYHSYQRPYNWGWLHWQTPAASEHNTHFTLLQCECIDQQGQWHCYTDDASRAIQLPLNKTGIIYVQWPAHTQIDGLPDYPKTTPEQSNWHAHYQTTADIYDDARQCEVCYALPQLKLSYAPDPLKINIPIAKIIQTQGRLHLDSQYLPPCIQLPQQHHLYLLLKNWLNKLKINYLSKNQQTISIIINHLQAQLCCLLASEQVHPYDFYQALLHALIQLSPTSWQEQTSYQHQDITQSLTNISDALFSTLEQLVQTNNKTIMLKKIQANQYEFQINSYKQANIKLLLTLQHPNPYPEWKKNREKQIKINQSQQLNQNMLHATAGLALTPIYQAEAHLYQCQTQISYDQQQKQHPQLIDFCIFIPDELSVCQLTLQQEEERHA